MYFPQISQFFLNFLSFSSTFSVFFNFFTFSSTFSVFIQLSQFVLNFLNLSSTFSVCPQLSQFLFNFFSFSSTSSVFPQLSQLFLNFLSFFLNFLSFSSTFSCESMQVCKYASILGPNFFDLKVTQPKLFQTERTRLVHLPSFCELVFISTSNFSVPQVFGAHTCTTYWILFYEIQENLVFFLSQKKGWLP